jgi:hypothetical protein
MFENYGMTKMNSIGIKVRDREDRLIACLVRWSTCMLNMIDDLERLGV